MIGFGGIVLCGGDSTRMGRPKAWLPFGTETLLERVTRLLGSVAHPVIVVGSPGQELPPLARVVEIVRDAEKGNGPLQGLVAGLEALGDRADTAFVSSCDAPFFRPELARRIRFLLENHDICVPRTNCFFHPLAAVYRTVVARHARRLLAEHRYRCSHLFEVVSTRFVTPEEVQDVDPDLRSLRNVNTPEEYRGALAEFLPYG